jgi:hypothetical protein
MAIRKSQLYNVASRNLHFWVIHKDETIPALLELAGKESSSLQRGYELRSFIWCETLALLFERLKRIREMTARSVYARGAQRNTILKEWVKYNYHIYMLIYQSVLDVALLLTNEILDLGIPTRQCNYNMICRNRRVKDLAIDRILDELSRLTEEHRRGKNLLLHRGISPPPRKSGGATISLDITNLAVELELTEEQIRSSLEEFSSYQDKTQLIQQMSRECEEIESVAERLMDALLPQYLRIHSFYTS